MTNKNFDCVYQLFVNTVYRICFSFLKNQADTEDAVQEVFLKYLNYNGEFEDNEHLKAWLIVSASNYCKNQLRHWWHRRKNIEDYSNILGNTMDENNEMLSIVFKLPAKYKSAIYMYYYEGYDSEQIGQILHISSSTVRSRLAKARKMLKAKLNLGDDAL